MFPELLHEQQMDQHPFLTIGIKGTTKGVQTNMDGKYTIMNVSS